MRKVESLKELNKIVQKLDYKKVGNWMARNITRDMALPFTKLFLYTNISAITITFISLIVALAGCVLFSFGTRIFIFWGAILLQIWYLLDHVDGQIARYRKQVSIRGVFLDYITHHIIHMAIFIGIGWGVYTFTSKVFYILFGIISSTSVLLINLIYDCQYKAFAYVIQKKLTIPEIDNTPSSTFQANSGLLFQMKKIFSLMHKLCEVHIVMNIVTGLAILQFFIKKYIWDEFMFIYLTLTLIVAVSRITYFILKDKPKSEFQNFIRLVIDYVKK